MNSNKMQYFQQNNVARPDYHKAITIKERSSRYIRTAFDYFRLQKGEEQFQKFLDAVQLSPSSSIFKHIYDDTNWNSYQLEVYLYEKIIEYFDDPFRAVWEFGVASGSGKLDQKDTLFAFKIKMAPVPVLIRRISETTEMVSLISETSATMLKSFYDGRRKMNAAEIIWNYVRLPENFSHPHWSSIVAGFGIVFGLLHYRKGLEADYKITHWPILPSDLPHFHGKHYAFDRRTKNITEVETDKIIANARSGSFEWEGVIFNHGYAAQCTFSWRAESLFRQFARLTYLAPQIRREAKLRQERELIMSELKAEHQQKLALYEEELSERSRIIQEKMQEIEKLKIQQDGDYFLTSLLTEPLIVNRNNSRSVKTCFIVRQKKTFYFRQRRSELGGDNCLTDNIVLQGINYTLFLNGDAMGKSMQGAGGALVLGVVFNAYLTRSRYSLYQQSKSPEQWLKDSYLDLQNVFISFNGSMFVSVVIGLVNEIDGSLYFINAEHPFVVLYRNKRAIFLDNEMHIRKIGTPGEEEKIRIQTIQLKPGDVVICGSDGRDDLELAIKDNMRIINEDEKAFLQRVEEGRGSLPRILVKLMKFGQLTDDLSLLRLSYLPDSVPADQKENEQHKIQINSSGNILENSNNKTVNSFFNDAAYLKRLVLQHFNSGEYPKRTIASLLQGEKTSPLIYRFIGKLQFRAGLLPAALANLTTYTNRFPLDTEIVWLVALCYFRLGQFADAADYAERAALREPEREYILVIIIQIFLQLDKVDSARFWFNRLVRMSPANLYIENLRVQIDRAVRSLRKQ